MKRIIRKSIKVLFLTLCVLAAGMCASAASSGAAVMKIGSVKTISGYSKVTSSKKGILKVAKSGKKYKLIPQKAGEVILKYYKNKKLKKKVSVLVVNPSATTYDSSDLVLKKGTSKTVTARGYKQCVVKYSSSNIKVATVDRKGKISAVANGTCTIKVAVTYKGKKVKNFKKAVKVQSSTPKNSSQGNSSNSPAATGTSDIKGVYCTISQTFVYVGEDFPDSAINVKAFYKDGTSRKITSYKKEFQIQNMPGKTNLRISYNGLSYTFDIEVKARKVVSGITASCIQPEVESGYSFTTDDIKVYANYTDGTMERIYQFSVTGGRKGTDPNYNLTISANGFTATLQVPVKASETRPDTGTETDKPGKETESETETEKETESDPETESETEPVLKSVSITLTSNSVYVNEDLNSGQIIVTATYSNGKKTNVTDFTHDFVPKSEPGSYPVNVSWNGYKKQFFINVKEDPANNVIGYEAKLIRTQLFLDDVLTKDDFDVTVFYGNGQQEKTEDFTFEYVPAKEHMGKAHISVQYGSFEAVTFDVTSYDRIMPKEIEVQVTNAVVGISEELNRDNLVVIITDLGGNVKEVKDYTIDFTPKSEPGIYDVTVSYKNIETTISIYVR